METVVEFDPRERRFTALAHMVGAPLRRYLVRRAPKDAVEDLLSDVMLVLWRRLDDVPEIDPLPWVFGVAHGCLANAERSRQRQARLVERISRVDPPMKSLHQAADSDEGDRPALVSAALATLSPLDLEVVRLWAWDGLMPRDIAMLVGISPNAVSIRLHRVKKKLAAEIGKDLGAVGQERGKGGSRDDDRR